MAAKPRPAMPPLAPPPALDASGLTEERAAALARVHGPNSLPTQRQVPWWRKLLAELTHFFAVMLWCAAVLAYVAQMPQLGAAIIVVIIVNGVFAHIAEEIRSEAARS